ncbi:DUF6446 family protein [Yoonia sp. R2331]|uniref:DUF6446 family protein n=1 Tax=Yoonia sp. R2331 TaxID=3237238 RepID=UPI0034E58F5F
MSALIAGVAMYYFQVYAFYDEVSAEVENVQMTNVVTGQAEPIVFENFKGIDSDSSPLRYRACFDVVGSLAMMTETYVVLEAATPLVAPGWFDCFDADQIGADLEAGIALPFLGQENVTYGIDRIVAVYPDGRAFAWHEINRCGEVVFDGDPVPADCPTPPEGLR